VNGTMLGAEVAGNMFMESSMWFGCCWNGLVVGAAVEGTIVGTPIGDICMT
jgi:hypothetical protein